MRILVTGSRDWTNRELVASAIVSLQSEFAEKGYDSEGRFVDWLTDGWTIVHGACPTGADAMADDFAVTSFMNVERHPADWKRWGKSAGFRRNAEMVQLGADVCLAFIRNKSRGATMTADLAAKAGIPLKVYRSTDGGPVDECGS